MLGPPGKPISNYTMRRLRERGVGPLLGDSVKTRIVFIRINSRTFRYPKREFDELIQRLYEKSRATT